MIGSRDCSDEQFQGTTEKPFKGYFKDWRIIRSMPDSADYTGTYIVGEFAGHPRFHGKRGHSSMIVHMKDSDGYWDVETLNSRYRLMYDEERPDREFWDMS